LPFSSVMREEQVDRVCGALSEILESTPAGRRRALA